VAVDYSKSFSACSGFTNHCFGDIVDDGADPVDVSWEQELVAHPKDARVRIQVV
jgi:hypothetical protein